jgi:hypothetical protein
MDGFHIERMAQNKGNILFAAEIGYPVPGKDTFYGNDNVFSVWCDGLQEDVGIRFDIPMQDDLSFLIEDA